MAFVPKLKIWTQAHHSLQSSTLGDFLSDLRVVPYGTKMGINIVLRGAARGSTAPFAQKEEESLCSK